MKARCCADKQPQAFWNIFVDGLLSKISANSDVMFAVPCVGDLAMAIQGQSRKQLQKKESEAVIVLQE